MFVSDVPEIQYNAPWLMPFDKRYALLMSKACKVAYFYHTPDDSTFRYRVYNMIQTLNHYSERISAAWFCIFDDSRMDSVIAAADVIVICRCGYSIFVGQLIDKAKRAGKEVIFDTDDLVFDVEYIPLIMDTLDQPIDHTGPWDYWYAYISRIAATLKRCDRATTTNQFLADRLYQSSGKSVRVIPNFMNEEQIAVSDKIYTKKEANGFESNAKVHIGYFSGSPSHNKDFAIVAPILADIMDDDEDLILRLAGHMTIQGPLKHHSHRIEIWPFRDFINLQRLIGSTEINIVPLQDNMFTNCKSELKYFEAGVTGTVTVASPTFPYRQSIQDGGNGYIANSYEWKDKLSSLVNSLKHRRADYERLAKAARHCSKEIFSGLNQLSTIESALFP